MFSKTSWKIYNEDKGLEESSKIRMHIFAPRALEGGILKDFFEAFGRQRDKMM